MTEHPVAIVATPLLLIGGIVATLFGTSQALSTQRNEIRLVVDDCIVSSVPALINLRNVENIAFNEVTLLTPIAEMEFRGEDAVVLGIPLAQQKEIERAWTECRE
jgi:hypothetical protein